MLTGNDDANSLYGNGGNDILHGGGGADLLCGGTGDDTYLYKPISNKFTIINKDGGADQLVFAGDITADRITYQRYGDNLMIKVDALDSTMVTVKDWFKGEAYQLTTIKFADGEDLSTSQINALVEPSPEDISAMVMMASFTENIDTLSSLDSSLDGGAGDYFQYSTTSGSLQDELTGSNPGTASEIDNLTSGEDKPAVDLLAAA